MLTVNMTCNGRWDPYVLLPNRVSMIQTGQGTTSQPHTHREHIPGNKVSRENTKEDALPPNWLFHNISLCHDRGEENRPGFK